MSTEPTPQDRCRDCGAPLATAAGCCPYCRRPTNRVVPPAEASAKKRFPVKLHRRHPPTSLWDHAVDYCVGEEQPLFSLMMLMLLAGLLWGTGVAAYYLFFRGTTDFPGRTDYLDVLKDWGPPAGLFLVGLVGHLLKAKRRSSR